MGMIDLAVRCEGKEDRAAVFEYAEGLVAVVADGAGGLSGGARAAQAVVDAVQRAGWAPDARTWVELLSRLDAEVGPGETTAVVVAMGPDRMVGASVGDSGAWWFDMAGGHELTRGQRRKPLLGSGGAVPVELRLEGRRAGTLVLASDGLWKYVPWDRLPGALQRAPAEAASRLVELVRYPSGELPDDVAVVVCRRETA
jgi:serine/threonine protein phosphatase PrpC